MQTEEPGGTSPEDTQGAGAKALVVYFSAAGNTKAVAETLAGYQVINAEQYDLRGCEVETYSDGKRGIAKERMAAAYGIKYRIKKTDGSVFTAYDSNLEVIRRPERRGKSCNRSKKKPKREMER